MEKIKEIFNPLLFLIVFLQFTVLTSHANPQKDRADFVESLDSNSIEQQTITAKIKTTRQLGLYLEDILPESGNVYSHGAKFLNDSTAELFNFVSSHSPSFSQSRFWLPLPNKNHQWNTASLEKNQNTRLAFEYLGTWLAALSTLDNTERFYRNSILVEPLEKTLSPETLKKYNDAITLIQFMRSNFEKAFSKQRLLPDFLRERKRLSDIALAVQIVRKMLPHLHIVKTNENQRAVDFFVAEVQKLIPNKGGSVTTKKYHLTSTELRSKKEQFKNLFTSAQFKQIKQAFSGIDLPDSSDIDGLDDSFEAVMRLEVGFDVIENIYSNLGQ